MICFLNSDSEGKLQLIKKYGEEKNISINNHLLNEDIKISWTDRELGKIFYEINDVSEIGFFDAPSSFCSMKEVISFLCASAKRGIDIHFIKYGLFIDNKKEYVKTLDIFNLLSKIDRDFISKRTIEALSRRKQAGLPLGRPHGRKNSSRKLEPHKSEIKRYLEIGLSKSSIAKLVKCHPQTLYNYVDEFLEK